MMMDPLSLAVLFREHSYGDLIFMTLVSIKNYSLVTSVIFNRCKRSRIAMHFSMQFEAVYSKPKSMKKLFYQIVPIHINEL